jgi:hypothetical protein
VEVTMAAKKKRQSYTKEQREWLAAGAFTGRVDRGGGAE